MSEKDYTYVIVGGGLAGASAVQGIRGLDKKGSLLLICSEKYLPYDRPPLSKKLWFGKKRVEEIFIHDRQFYDQNAVELLLGSSVVSLDAVKKTISDSTGRTFRFDKLLLSTGGVPKRLPVPGGDLEGICYYRYLDDYLRMRQEAGKGKSVTVIGGGFIGSEIAAALSTNRLKVTMVFPGTSICDRVFPKPLSAAVQQTFSDKGVRVISGDSPGSFEKRGSRFITRTGRGLEIESDMVVAGIGISPSEELALGAGLETGDGISVNQFLQTSDPDIYAAGDNASFPYQALERRMRVEHWDNALNQGLLAGKNMAGAHEPYTHMPYFFSDLFEFGYEAVGDVSSRLEIFSDWVKENDTGVVYYLHEGKVRGAMMCNIWEKVDMARELIRSGQIMAPEDLRGLIR